MIENGKSWERKAYSKDSCVSASGDGEFLGNGCPSDNGDAFEMRAIPNPQNGTSLPEPREKPVVPFSENEWAILYDPNSVSISFSWPQITEGHSVVITNKESEENIPIGTPWVCEENKSYEFDLRIMDADGMVSSPISKSVQTGEGVEDSKTVLYEQTDSSYSHVFSAEYFTNNQATQYIGDATGRVRYARGKVGANESGYFHLSLCALNSGSLWENDCVERNGIYGGGAVPFMADGNGEFIIDLGEEVDLDSQQDSRPYIALNFLGSRNDNGYYANQITICGSNQNVFPGGSVYANKGEYSGIYFGLAGEEGF